MKLTRMIFHDYFLPIFLLLTLALLSGCSASKSNTSFDDVHALRQLVTTNTNLSRTIMWNSNREYSSLQVEYRLKGSDKMLHQSAQAEKFVDDKVTYYIYTAELTALEPQKEYEYRISNGQAQGAWHTLQTGDGASFSALIFPDTQSADYSGVQRLAHQAWTSHKDAQLYISMGDLVDNGEDKQQWQGWFDAMTGLRENIPLAAVMGNHETYNLAWKVRQPAAFTHFFHFPTNGNNNYANQFYAFDYGQVHFTVVDTQFKEEEAWQPNLSADEIAWLQQDLANTKQPWKIVLLHKDPLQYAFANRPQTPREEGFSSEGRLLMPLFDKYGVDVVLSAHLHTYRRRGTIKNFRRADQGPYYILTGVAGDVRYPNLWRQHHLDEFVAPQPEKNNYLVLEATPARLTFTCFAAEGQLIDKAVITKNND